MTGLTLHLDKIQDVIQVSAGKARHLMETCVWCLLASSHANGVNIRVDEDGASDSYAVSWPDEEVDVPAINISYNQDDATQYGAEAIALLVAIERTEYTAVVRAMTGTGIDYWLGYKDNLNNPFKRASRLEMSGLFKESATNTVKSRVKAKFPQTRPTDHLFSVYIIVVEFGEPYATMVKK